MGFGSRLVTWRKEAGLTQAALEKAINKSSGYLARVEKGDFAPPRKVTDQIAQALRDVGSSVTDEEVWNAAAPEVADPHVRAYYEARIAEERAERDRRVSPGASLTRDEAALLATIRGLRVPGNVAALLDEYLMLLRVLALHAPLEVVLKQLFELPLQLPEQLAAHAVRTAAEHSASLLEAWEAATSDPDSRAG